MEAKRKGDHQGLLYAEERVACFTNQLNEANPLLTEISDAMKEEGECKGEIEIAILLRDEERSKEWTEKLERASRKKEIESSKLMQCSARYAKLMKELRESFVQVSASR